MTGSTPTARPRSAVTGDALEFSPGLLALQESPPAPFPRGLLYALLGLVLALVLWCVFGRLDIIASAEGRLVPERYVQIVQPAQAGIVREILVREGESVRAGQVLVRMDPVDEGADLAGSRAALAQRSLQVRRVDAELADRPLARRAGDPDDLLRHVSAQLEDRRRAYRDNVAQLDATVARAEQDLASGRQTLEKLRAVNPLLESQARAYADIGKDGYAPTVVVNDKQREYLENTQEMHAQEARVASLAAAVVEARQQRRQVTSKYRADLQNERSEAEAEVNRLTQDVTKHTHQASLLELTAPTAGVVKDLSTHTLGTVVSAGSVLLSLVPEHEPVVADVIIRNDDVGFVQPQQRVEVKIAPYPFQKYGMVAGRVLQVWPDAADEDAGPRRGVGAEPGPREASGGYRARISLETQALSVRGHPYPLVSGMQVTAEIHEGHRSVLEYLLSPLQRVAQEGGRER